MITAVDTNILLDILIPGEPFKESSKALLEEHLSRGSLILCEVVFAELASFFQSEDELGGFLLDTGMALVPSDEKSLYIAGERWADYSRKSSRSKFTCTNCGRLRSRLPGVWDGGDPAPPCPGRLSRRRSCPDPGRLHPVPESGNL